MTREPDCPTGQSLGVSRGTPAEQPSSGTLGTDGTRGTRQHLPNRRLHVSQTFDHGGIEYVLGAGCFEDGTLAELFVATRKYGTAADVAIRDASIAASLALQYGVPLDVLRRAVTRDGNGAASGALGRALDILAGRP